jgi:predicted nucleic acid-binding protein
VRRAVLDAGVVIGWFDRDGPHRSLRAEYESGELTVVAPRHLVADVLAIASDRIPPDRLPSVGAELDRVRFQLQDPPLPVHAVWIAKGLPADRAAYAALAAHLEVPLVTDDPELQRVAAAISAG